MTNYSKQALRDSALEEIRVKDVGADMSGPEVTAIDNEVQRVIEYLEDEALIAFDSSVGITTENIPGRFFNALRDMVAETIAPRFDIATRTVAGPNGPESMHHNAMRRLRRSMAEDPDEVPVKAVFF